MSVAAPRRRGSDEGSRTHISTAYSPFAQLAVSTTKLTVPGSAGRALVSSLTFAPEGCLTHTALVEAPAFASRIP